MRVFWLRDCVRQSLQSMISGLQLFSRQHLRRAVRWFRLSTGGILSEQKYGMRPRPYDDLARFPGLRQMLREYPQAPFMIRGCKTSRGILWRRPRQALIGFRGIADHSLFAGATLSATPAITSSFSPTSEAISSTGT